MLSQEKAARIAEKSKEEGLPRLRKISVFYEKSLELIDSIEKQKIRAEQLKSRDLVIRRKHYKKMAKTARKLTGLFNTINQSFLNNEIQELEGGIFAKALRHALGESVSTISRPSCPTCHLSSLRASAGTTSKARNELSQLDSLVTLYAGYNKEKAWIGNQIKETKRQLGRIGEGINEKPNGKVLPESIKNRQELAAGYEKALELTRAYQSLRKSHLKEMKERRAVDLMQLLFRNQGIVKLGFPTAQSQESLASLKGMIEQDFPNLLVGDVLEYRKFTRGKLLHYTPQPDKFKKLVEENSNWLVQLKELESTPFLDVSVETPGDKLKLAAAFFGGSETGSVLRQLAALTSAVDIEKARAITAQKEEAVGDSKPALAGLKKERRELQKELEQQENLSKLYSVEAK